MSSPSLFEHKTGALKIMSLYDRPISSRDQLKPSGGERDKGPLASFEGVTQSI